MSDCWVCLGMKKNTRKREREREREKEKEKKEKKTENDHGLCPRFSRARWASYSTSPPPFPPSGDVQDAESIRGQSTTVLYSDCWAWCDDSRRVAEHGCRQVGEAGSVARVPNGERELGCECEGD